MTATHKRLGEMCLEAGLLDAARLEAALRTQQGTGERLGRVLARTKALPEAAVVKLLGVQLGLRSVDADGVRIHPLVLQQLPGTVAHAMKVLPIGMLPDSGQQVLFVATSDPQNAQQLAALEMALGKPVRPVVAGEEALRRAVERHYGPPPAEASIPPGQQLAVVTPAPMPAAPPAPAAAPPAPGLPFPLPGGAGLLSLDAPRPAAQPRVAPNPPTPRPSVAPAMRPHPAPAASTVVAAPPIPTMAAPAIPPPASAFPPPQASAFPPPQAAGPFPSPPAAAMPQPHPPAAPPPATPMVQPTAPSQPQAGPPTTNSAAWRSLLASQTGRMPAVQMGGMPAPPHTPHAAAPVAQAATPMAPVAQPVPAAPHVEELPSDDTLDNPVLVAPHEFLEDANAVAIGLTEVPPDAPPEPVAVVARAVAVTEVDLEAIAVDELGEDLIERGPPGHAAHGGDWARAAPQGGLELDDTLDGGSLELASAHEFIDTAAQVARGATHPADKDRDDTLDTVELDGAQDPARAITLVTPAVAVPDPGPAPQPPMAAAVPVVHRAPEAPQRPPVVTQPAVLVSSTAPTPAAGMSILSPTIMEPNDGATLEQPRPDWAVDEPVLSAPEAALGLPAPQDVLLEDPAVLMEQPAVLVEQPGVLVEVAGAAVEEPGVMVDVDLEAPVTPGLEIPPMTPGLESPPMTPGLEVPPLTPWPEAAVQTSAADVVSIPGPPAAPGTAVPAPTLDMLRVLIVQGLVEDALVETFVAKGLVSREEVERLKAMRR